MAKKQMNYNYMYKGQKNNQQMKSGYEKYTPGMVGKIAMAVTVPSAAIAFISVMLAVFGMLQALHLSYHWHEVL